jgi:hypothetical protein
VAQSISECAGAACVRADGCCFLLAVGPGLDIWVARQVAVGPFFDYVFVLPAARLPFGREDFDPAGRPFQRYAEQGHAVRFGANLTIGF